MASDVEKRIRIVTESIVLGEEKLQKLQSSYVSMSKRILSLSKNLSVSNNATQKAKLHMSDLAGKIGKLSDKLIHARKNSKNYNSILEKIGGMKRKMQAYQDIIKGENKNSIAIKDNISALKLQQKENRISTNVLKSSLKGQKKELSNLTKEFKDKPSFLTADLYSKSFRNLRHILGMSIPEFKKLDNSYKGLSEKERARVPIMNRGAIALKNLTHGTSRFKMELLGVMFFGMSLQRAMTSLISTSLDWMGVNEILSSTLGELFLPIAEKVLDIVLFFSSIVDRMSDKFKLFIGAVAVGILVFGATIAILGQLLLGIGSLLLATNILIPGMIAAGASVLGLAGASATALTPLASMSAILIGGTSAAGGFTAATTTATTAVTGLTTAAGSLLAVLGTIFFWVTAVILVITAIVMITKMWIDNWDMIGETVDYFWKKIKSSFTNGFNWLADRMRKFNPITWLKDVGSTVKDWFAGLFKGDGEEESGEETEKTLKDRWTEMGEWFKKKLSEIGSFFKTWFWDKPKEWIESSVGWIQQKWSDLGESMSNILSEIGGFFKTWFWDKPVEYATNGFNWIVEKWNSLRSLTGVIFSEIGGFFKTWFWDKPREWIESSVGWIQQKWNSLRSLTGVIFSEIGGFFKTWFWDKPREWLEDLWMKVVEIYGKIKKTVLDTPIIGSSIKLVGNLLGSFQTGGTVPQTGPYLLHKGEEVIPTNQVNSYNSSTPQYNITINANVSSSYDVRNLAEEIKRYLSLDYNRTSMGR